MTSAFAALLGAVQGVTEFLPISSKTHLVVVPALLGHKAPSLEFIVLLHLGTLVALVLYFARDLWTMLVGLVRGGPSGDQGRKLAIMLIVASIPAAIFGLLFENTFERLLSHPKPVAFSLVATAVILTAAEWFAGTFGRPRRGRLARPLRSEPTMRDAVVIGLAQSVALLPGVSRSGSTMSTGLALGLRREAVARFSFLLAIPAIAGANVLELPKALEHGVGGPEIAGFVSALVTGFVSVAFLLRYLRRYTYLPFAAYCLVFAIAAGLLL